ncbi:arginase [Caldilinea sp.]|uniref:arginase n=1 Tax=Caldilinea sp. TaxID=2293560 RepID=UPI002C47B223|nr:arginase [Anaerolineales bacterium]HQY90885.1 arginase [Caldilinea sp.]HRA65102.1 arginase [Caldilinea sp.]
MEINLHPRNVKIVGAPMDLGQQRRGVDMGPSAVRYAGLYDRIEQLGHTVHDVGNIPVAGRDEDDVRRERWVETEGGGLRHLHAVTAACHGIYTLASACDAADFPIFLGGDHSMAIGTISGMAAKGPLGVIWIDAHGDFNTPDTSPSGNIHGMPMAVLTGLGHPDLVNLGTPGAKLRAQDIVMIAIRDLDLQERIALSHSGIIVYTMRDIDELGMATVARRALARLNRLPRIHVSLDMDALEPAVAAGVGTPVTGGLTFREAHLLMEILAESEKVCSLDIVEVNPILDEGNRTAEVAVALTASLLGQQIL